ncbi:Uncharacterized protein Rs2_40810 [Raphanus sativus]|nr:Uncharacterized protein Rs2_40810 [Raphanus sativus]
MFWESQKWSRRATTNRAVRPRRRESKVEWQTTTLATEAADEALKRFFLSSEGRKVLLRRRGQTIEATVMQATINASRLNRFRHKLTAGKIYSVSDFDITRGLGCSISRGELQRLGSSTVTLDMVHGGHVLALEKNKRGMMRRGFGSEIGDFFTY